MVLVFTANSNNSEEMTKELAIASQQRLIVIPLRVEDVAPGDAFTYEFATRQWIDVFADWESSIDQLTRRISRALEGTMPTPEAAAPAPKAAQPVMAPPAVEPLATAAPDPAPTVVKFEAAQGEAAAVEEIATDDRLADTAREPAEKRRPRTGMYALIAASIAIAVIGVTLLGKPEPQLPAAAPAAPMVTVSNATAAEASPTAPPLVAMSVTEVAPDPVAEPVKRRAAPAKAETDIPY
jgi:hypothetical protein